MTAPDKSAGLTMENVEQALVAMGDPTWHLTDSYRTLLLAHDAALRERVRVLEVATLEAALRPCTRLHCDANCERCTREAASPRT